VSWVLDCDVRGFYDTIDREWMPFSRAPIADKRILRLSS
jgi:hypothetical protein